MRESTKLLLAYAGVTVGLAVCLVMLVAMLWEPLILPTWQALKN